MLTLQERLSELEEQFILGEILESDYKDQKKTILDQIRSKGETIDNRSSVQFAEFKNAMGMSFCFVPAGPFYQGQNQEAFDLKCAYYISKYPVTLGQYKAFLKDNDIGLTDDDHKRMAELCHHDNCPVTHISFNDAKNYCRWLRKVTGDYYSLPHEVEWEKAARGEDGRFYPWGNEAITSDMACYYGGLQYHATVPVGSYEKNVSPYGCVDMVGNVWEWCLDSFPDERDPHIMRGGAWCNEQQFCNALSRTYAFPPTKRIDYVGIRLIYLPKEMFEKYKSGYGPRHKSTSLDLSVVSLQLKETESKKDETFVTKNECHDELSKAVDKAVKGHKSVQLNTRKREEQSEPVFSTVKQLTNQVFVDLPEITDDKSTNNFELEFVSGDGVIEEKDPTPAKTKTKAPVKPDNKEVKPAHMRGLFVENEPSLVPIESIKKDPEKSDSLIDISGLIIGDEKDGEEVVEKGLKLGDMEELEKASPFPFPKIYTQLGLVIWVGLVIFLLIQFIGHII